jgi:beta-xylosidase
MAVTATTDTSATPMERADELLRQMTLEEKAMQLVSVVPLTLLGADGPIRDQMDSLLGHGIGHVAGIGLLGTSCLRRSPRASTRSSDISSPKRA